MFYPDDVSRFGALCQRIRRLVRRLRIRRSHDRDKER
jgi:hypothetical protein